MPTNDKSQIPDSAPLNILTEADHTGENHQLFYNSSSHLRKCFRIPIKFLHFNIENGRYASKWELLKKAHPGVSIDPKQDLWKREILQLLDGTWEDQTTGQNTKDDRKHFQDLAEDIKVLSQQIPGIVLENGAVISGNRRLAALMTLYSEHGNAPVYERFKAFIIPGNLNHSDRWRLEMAAQIAPARLTKDYGSVDKLLKIEEGINALLEDSPNTELAQAVKAVAQEMGKDDKYIMEQLEILRCIKEYLNAIGHPGEWWLAEDKTEIMTEMPPLVQACETNDVPWEDRAKIKRSIYETIKCGALDYREFRKIRGAIGPVKRSRGTNKGVPEAVKILAINAPSASILQQQPTENEKASAEELVERVCMVIEASKDTDSPMVKAERAETNLRKIKEILDKEGSRRGNYPTALEGIVKRCGQLADEILSSLQR
jgi:hypothetical protein